MTNSRTVLRAHLAVWYMVEVGEASHPTVIDTDGHRKQWVGIGWIDEGPATAEDKATLPYVKED